MCAAAALAGHWLRQPTAPPTTGTVALTSCRHSVFDFCFTSRQHGTIIDPNPIVKQQPDVATWELCGGSTTAPPHAIASNTNKQIVVKNMG